MSNQLEGGLIALKVIGYFAVILIVCAVGVWGFLNGTPIPLLLAVTAVGVLAIAKSLAQDRANRT
jgi:hypothetical protein